MALSDIKHNIEEQAKKEAGGIRESASKEGEAIIGDARERAKGILQSAERQTEEELKRLREVSEASAELAAKNITLTAREEALSGEASKIKRLLAKCIRASQSYGKIFKNAIRQAREVAPPGELVITVSKADRAKLGNIESKIETKEMGGGLMISSKSGDISIDATVDKLIGSRSEEIRNALLAEMFGGEKRQKPSAGRTARKPRKATARKSARGRPRKAAARKHARGRPRRKSKR